MRQQKVCVCVCECVRACMCVWSSSAEGYIKTSFNEEFSLIKSIGTKSVQKIFLMLTLLF